MINQNVKNSTIQQRSDDVPITQNRTGAHGYAENIVLSAGLEIDSTCMIDRRRGKKQKLKKCSFPRQSTLSRWVEYCLINITTCKAIVSFILALVIGAGMGFLVEKFSI